MAEEAPIKFEGVFQEKYLWEDPLLSDDRFKDKTGPILTAEEIWEYVTKYGLLIASDFYESNLKGASYSMRPDSKAAWRYDEKGDQLKLDLEEDDEGRFYRARQNSLVYIRLQQRLRLPYYIIGRHNLTIKYVYQGLLLGTGPQVDPGFEENLYIPLHNLTNKDVKIYLHKSFVSIDYVRTSSLLLDQGLPKSRVDFTEKYPKKRPIPQWKLERMKLSDYLKGAAPTSSLGVFFPRLEKNEEKVEKGLEKIEKRRFWDLGLPIGLVVAFLAAMSGAYYNLDTKLESKTLPFFLNKQTGLPAISERLGGLEQTLKGLGEVEEQLRKNQLDSMKSTESIAHEVRTVQDTVRVLMQRVEKLEKEANGHQTNGQ